MNSEIGIVIVWFANLIGLIEWGALTLLLMEVTVCKDVRMVKPSRILSRNLSARLRLFKRSFRSAFYRSSVGLFFGSLLAVFVMINKLWMGIIITEIFPWSVFSLFFPMCLFIVYREIGFSLTFFDKFKCFIRGEE